MKDDSKPEEIPGQAPKPSSAIPGFHDQNRLKRLQMLKSFAGLSGEHFEALSRNEALELKLVESFIENAIGSFCLPFGVASNFLIDGRDYLVPMAVEETSVVAAASNGARIVRLGGGFHTEATDPIMTGEVHFIPEGNPDLAGILHANEGRWIDILNAKIAKLKARGGGVRAIRLNAFPGLPGVVFHVDVDTRDAMGANIVNSTCEVFGEVVAASVPGRVGLRILTNLCSRRMARARCDIPVGKLGFKTYKGAQVAAGITEASLMAEADPYRAATHNKGIMNGIDPIVIATGNDWRAVEAGAHAFAGMGQGYRPLSTWRYDEKAGLLTGKIEMPMSLGTVGGVTRLHPAAAASLALLGNPGATELARIAVAVGLAQNLSALRALATEGIQNGHMRLHQSNLELLRLEISRQKK